ncbi:acyl-CoA dehydrogenase family protein [Xanthomonas euvesicatoria]|uniref:acyl-CoA dehydrogenase family protein n=1 Tax=Xanthomonas euvesicatoria TaxID=456327 RepID=UPI001C485C1D|nr:acyl-CoA dehydrogenase family protein [Xanthomonas euvesicatoria]MBV6776504.1 acyl-CoA dehydrogenase family protein [Xanthomonas campestris pv. carissae]
MNAQAVFPSDTSPQLGAPTDAALAQRFDPVFARIAEGALARERERILAHEPVAWLRAAGFGAVRVPQAHGGLGASLPQLLRLLARLGEADSNLPQILRAHFGFVEGLYGSTADDAALRARWFPRVAAGALFGAAMAERGPATENTLTLRRDGAHWQLDGEKFYSTGTLYADWILAAAVDGGDQPALAVPADAQGVTRIDDWDGFGQRLTGSGSTHFRAVRLQDEHVLHRHPAGQARPDNYLTAFYQSVHLATLTGIARAVLRDGVEFVRARTRVFGVPGQTRPADDPLVQRVVGRLSSLAFAADAVVEQVGVSLQQAHLAHHAGTASEADYIAADLAAYHGQQVVLPLVLEASTLVFEVGGASATARERALDRHWRNARTIASHNPAILRERALGDWRLNGRRPREAWFAGTTSQSAAGADASVSTGATA